MPALVALLAGQHVDLPAAAQLLAPLRAVALDSAAIPEPLRCGALGCSAFEACYQATYRGYSPVVLPLLAAAAHLASVAQGYALPTHALDELRLQAAAYFSRSSISDAMHIEQELLASAGEEALHGLSDIQGSRPSMPNPQAVSSEVCVTGSLLFTGSQQRQVVSAISRKRVSGPTVALEDGVSLVSKSEAIMWAKLHPFSPSHSGKLLNPF